MIAACVGHQFDRRNSPPGGRGRSPLSTTGNCASTIRSSCSSNSMRRWSEQIPAASRVTRAVLNGRARQWHRHWSATAESPSPPSAIRGLSWPLNVPMTFVTYENRSLTATRGSTAVAKPSGGVVRVGLRPAGPGRTPILSRGAVVLAVAVMAVSAVVLVTPLALTPFGLYFDDLGELVAALIAAAAAFWRSRQAGSPKLRRAWLLIALASASWAVGEALVVVVRARSGQGSFSVRCRCRLPRLPGLRRRGAAELSVGGRLAQRPSGARLADGGGSARAHFMGDGADRRFQPSRGQRPHARGVARVPDQ